MARITFLQVQIEQSHYNNNRADDEPYIGLRRNNGMVFIEFYKCGDFGMGCHMIHNDSYGHSTHEAWAILHAMNEQRVARKLMK